jgi:hypothetical protein
MQSEDKFDVKDFSIIVAAQLNNPTILNPDFLRSNDIVPAEFKLLETTTSPLLSKVIYEIADKKESGGKKNIAITVEPARVTFSENHNGKFPSDSFLPKIASIYIDVLKHVPYVSLGINWWIIVKQSDPATWLNGHFIKKDVLLPVDRTLSASAIRFEFKHKHAHCNLSLEPWITPQGKALAAIANFHHEPQKKPFFAPGEIRPLIEQWPDLQLKLREVLQSIFK